MPSGFNSDTHQIGVEVPFVRPYDFALSRAATGAFRPASPLSDDSLHLPARIGSVPVSIEVTASERGGIEAVCRPASDVNRVRSIVQWVLFAELDLSPFYRLVEEHPKLAPVVSRLHGLKPTRPVSLFEMAVIAITEQQLSLASAYHIRDRLVRRFGEALNGLWVFPEPGVLAAASLEDLRSCGLSKQKAGYIQGLARRITVGDLDIDTLKEMSDEEARETIMGWRGFGRWSADYMLVRGLARPDCVPIDDLGIRDVIGSYLNEGKRATPDEVTQKLEVFRPYRGLLAFYLLVNRRFNPPATPVRSPHR